MAYFGPNLTNLIVLYELHLVAFVNTHKKKSHTVVHARICLEKIELEPDCVCTGGIHHTKLSVPS